MFLERTKYRIRIGRGDSPDRGNICYNRVGRGLAPAVNSHRTLRRGQAPALPSKLYFVLVGNGLDRSENLPIHWGRLPHSVREMSRSDRGRPPPSAGGTPQGVTEGQITSKSTGGRGNPPLQTGRRLGALYPLPLRGRWLLPQAKDGGRETEKSLPQSNALHLTAPSSEGA